MELVVHILSLSVLLRCAAAHAVRIDALWNRRTSEIVGNDCLKESILGIDCLAGLLLSYSFLSSLLLQQFQLNLVHPVRALLLFPFVDSIASLLNIHNALCALQLQQEQL